jgi:hypothetical protein
VLRHEHRVAVQAIGEVGECLVGFVAESLYELGVEHERLTGTAEQIERGLLRRREAGR